MSKLQNSGNTAVVGAGGGGGGGSGDVVGPASATNNAPALFSGATGKLIKSPAGLTYDGTDLVIQGQIASRHGSTVTEVFSAADLPAPSAGTITLVTGTYTFHESFTIADTLTVPAGVIVELLGASFGLVLTYSGTGTFINTAAASRLRVTNLDFAMTGVGATLFDIVAASASIANTSCNFAAAGQSIGSASLSAIGLGFQVALFSGFETGLSISGAAPTILENCIFTADPGFSGEVVTLASASTIFSADGVIFDAALGSAFAIDSGFTGNATITRISLIGGDFFAGGALDETSPYVDVQLSPPQKPSFNIGSLVVVDNPATTSIVSTGAYVDLDLNASASLGSNAELWSVTNAGNGELTYNGLTPFYGSAHCGLAVKSVGGTQDYNFRLVKNGAPMIDGVIGASSLGNNVKVITLIVPITAVTGDAFKIQVTNIESTNDVNIVQLSMEIA